MAHVLLEDANAEPGNVDEGSYRDFTFFMQLLPSRISAVMKASAAAGEDPFARVKDLITDFTNRLQTQASSEANHVSYRDDELNHACVKKADLENQVATRTLQP